jgi:hypothetical protein
MSGHTSTMTTQIPVRLSPVASNIEDLIRCCIDGHAAAAFVLSEISSTDENPDWELAFNEERERIQKVTDLLLEASRTLDTLSREMQHVRAQARVEQRDYSAAVIPSLSR